MSVYFNHQAQCPNTEDRSEYGTISWHPHYAILAVVSKSNNSGNGGVFFCYNEGELIEEINIQHSMLVQSIQWHPDRKIIASGWQNGVIITCNVHESSVYEQTPLHESPVTILQWSTTGSHLFSADTSGLIAVWRVETTGQLHPTPSQQSKLTGRPTHCALLPSNSRSLKKTTSSDSLACVVSVDSGLLYLMNDNGHCVEVEHVHKTLSHLLYSREKSLLAALTEDMLLVLLTVEKNTLTKVSEAKLGGKGAVSSMIWISPGVLATCSQEAVIRIWDCLENENYLLSLKEYIPLDDNIEVVTKISYDDIAGLLAAGTNSGHTLIWRRMHSDSTSQWQFITSSICDGNVFDLSWGPGKHLLATSHGTSVQILSEHQVSAHFNQEVSAVQISVNEFICQSHLSGTILTVSTDLMISGVTVTKEYVAVWDGRTINVYSIMFEKGQVKQTGSFPSLSTTVAIHEHNVYTVEQDQLYSTSLQGVVKHCLPLGIVDTVTSLRVTGHFLVLATVNGTVKMFDLSRREPKLVYSKPISEVIPNFSTLSSAQSNCNGTKISLVINKTSNTSLVVIVDSDKDLLKVLDFSAIEGPVTSDEYNKDIILTLPDQLPPNVEAVQRKLASQLHDVDMVSTHWDPYDPRLLVIEAKRDSSVRKNTSIRERFSKQHGWEAGVLTVFMTQDLHYLVQDVAPMSAEYNNIIGCTAPYIYYMRKNITTPLPMDTTSTSSDTEPLLPSPVERIPLRDFLGLEECDAATVKAMLSFSYQSTIGNMDEAFKAIKTIKSQRVWESLAKMCVKTRRLDVALVCLGNMGDARAAKAVREAQVIPELDAQLAVLALQLGMWDEAEDLYKASGRYDLLNQFYQISGRWQKAIEVAELNDRMHLKNTYFNFARYSEGLGEIKPAIKSYEQADTHQFEVVRMLLNDPDELEEYVLTSQDKRVQHCWAEHLECSGDIDSAIQQYQLCDDIQSTVRLLMHSGEVEQSIRIVEDTGNKPAAYHVARILANSEELPSIHKAINFFTMAQCYSPAINLAKKHGLETELMNLALLSTREDKIDAAKYYETSSESKDKAILLYQKAGELSCALNLCFKYRQYDILQQIAEELSEDTNPETVQKVAEFFVQQEQFDKAVQLLIQSNKISEALNMCQIHHVTITEELADRLTPETKDNETEEQTKQRLQSLEILADVLTAQGSYHLAAKKYTQAGNKIKAMKAVLKSGDTKAIIFFANVSRQKEIYVMAANYLQSLDWRGNPDIMKTIIGFYTKGRALETLANFYDVCAQVEIDEFQNYERAQGALNEAITVLSKAKTKNLSTLEEKREFLSKRLALIKRFTDARKLYSDNPEESIHLCQTLLEEPHLDVAIRVGDIYALLIMHCSHHKDFEKACSYIEEMKRRIPGVNLEFYITSETLQAINAAQGLTQGMGSKNRISEEEDEESDDSVEELVD